jgi:PAS domain S-box-containing protein
MPVAREKIIEVLQEGILVADQQGRAIDLNPQMKKILGQQGRSYIGDTLDKLFTEIDLLNEADRAGQNHQLEISRKEAGQTRFYSVTITPLPERKTIHTGNVFLFRDITERKLNEQKLEELNQLKDRLFSIIAHDLRSPLISLADMLKLTEEGDLSNNEFISLLPELSKNIGYTFGLVENLLYWARSQLSGATVKPSLFDLHPVIEHLLGLFQHNANEKGIKIHNKIRDGVFVYADADMIQVVLRNLVANAIKFCRNGDLIFINASCTDDMITLSVEDTGIGISKENLSRLFALENFTTRGTVNEQGTGLGLMLCQEFIEKNNGTISVDSTLGQGSRFQFSLPHKQPESTLPA